MLKEVYDNLKTAVIYGRTDVIRSILDASENGPLNSQVSKDLLLNSKILPEGSLLLLATQLNQIDVVRNLLSSGADPNVCNAYKAVDNDIMRQLYVEELMRATANAQLERITQLLDAGVSVNSVDSEEGRNTPLHYAASYANSQVTSLLLQRGADVDAVNSYGATALHDAIGRGDRDIVVTLLDHGANIHVIARKGKFARKSCLELAQSNEEIANIINTRINFNDSSEIDEREYSKREVGSLLSESVHSDTASTNQYDLQLFKSAGSDGVVAVNPFGEQVSYTGGRRRHISEGAGGVSGGPQVISPPRPMSRSASVMYASQSSSLDLTPKLDEMMERLTVKCPIKPLVTHPSLHLLWPQPQSIIELGGSGFTHQKLLLITVLQGPVSVHRILDVWEVSSSSLLSLGYKVQIGDVQGSVSKYPSSPVECSVNPSLFQSEDAYQIHIASNKIQMSAGSLRGLHYSILTLVQLLRLCPESDLPPLLIQDRSSLKHRGILLDFSPRGRIPCLEYLLSLLDLFSTLKINYLHLYTRLLPSCDWQLCYSKSEMIAIDRRAQDRFITLVPVLDVDDSVSEAVDSLWPTLHEVLTCFPSLEYIHIGPRLSVLLTHNKEPEELQLSTCGSDVSSQAEECSRSLMSRLCGLPATIMLCANSLRAQPRPSLPRNVVLMDYGFMSDYDFHESSKEFQQDGAIMCYCPGTASWNSLSGCPEAAVCNIYCAVQCANTENGLGIVLAHWSGSYHLTPHTFASPGFLLAAGLAWNPKTHLEYLQSSLGELLDAHVLQDSAGVTGRALLGLGYFETYVLRASRQQKPSDASSLPDPEGSTLYKLLTDPDAVNLEHLNGEIFNRVTKHIKKHQKELLKAKLSCPFGEMVVQEALLSADLMLTACRVGRALLAAGANPNSNMGLAVINLGVAHLSPTFRTDIANKLLAHIEQYKGTWLQRHLPGGLQTSLLILTSALQRFVPPDDPLD